MQPEGMETQTPLDFLANASAGDVVKAVLAMLQNHHEMELERLNDILDKGLPAPCADRLARTWERLKAECGDDGKALCLLAQAIVAELDTGDGP